MPSDIHVFIHFKEPSVFAGEEINCTITFRNVADVQAVQDAAQIALHARRRSRQGSISQLAANSRAAGFGRGLQNPRLLTVAGGNGKGNARGRHKATMSLSIPSEFNPSAHGSREESPAGFPRPHHKTQRSVSIISSGSPNTTMPPDGIPTRPGRPPVGSHVRSSTMQAVPATGNSSSQSHEGLIRQNSGSSPSSSAGLQIPNRNGRRSPLSSAASPSTSHSQSRQSTPDFKFPIADKRDASPQDAPLQTSAVNRLVSDSSLGGSERSSTEFHSLSNHSQETLMSEQASLASERVPFPPSRVRQSYVVSAGPSKKAAVANLLMGYAQVNATFTLDGSLVDQSPFEEVKRKGFLGGQAGGGVVGMRKPQTKSGLLSGFSLNSIGESLGSLMGGSDMSSVKEMKAVANSRAIPLLSTPQSLLFVDLRLSPGEDRSFTFSYKLPRGLPSNHRGKAIRIAYNLTIGVQGAPGDRDMQSVRQINIPLRVFSGVNQDGEIFGHDLMQPHVILRDVAQTAPTDLADDTRPNSEAPSPSAIQTSSTEFLSYVDTLLDKNRRRQSSSGTLDANFGFGGSSTKAFRPARQAIERAILFSNQLGAGENSPNRFEITRSGLHVAVVILDRPLHRLGETITAIIDFSSGQLLCSSIRATLESSEKVNASLAVRSATSINRVTRKTYASHSENTLFARRVVFSPSIPESATPTFLTSGVNLEWCLKFEFGTSKLNVDPEVEGSASAVQTIDLLEEIVTDERGIIKAAVENVDCETFEVVIPITVYGDVMMTGIEEDEVIGIPI